MVSEKAGDDTIPVLITEPDEVKGRLRTFFEEWMGKGQTKWFRREGWTHPIFERTLEGMQLRRQIVDGSGDPDLIDELAATIPEQCRPVLGWWKRKRVRENEGVADEHQNEGWTVCVRS